MTLEQLAVVSAPQITFDSKVPERMTVEFTPTVPHCGMSTFIGACRAASNADIVFTCRTCDSGLSIRVRLMRSLPPRYKVDIRVKPGSHQSEHACACPLPCDDNGGAWLIAKFKVNKQLNDKERVAAALENPALLEVLEQCLSTAGHQHTD